MRLPKFLKALLYPHAAVMITLLPVAIAGLVCSMVLLGTESPISIVAYVVSAYTLTVWCIRIPEIVALVRRIRNENRLVLRWRRDDRLRVMTTLYGSLVFNCIYAVFQLWLGIYHRTFWYCSFAIYYFLLATVRFFLVRHTGAHKPGERQRAELVRYLATGVILLLMNSALLLIIFFMVYWGRTFVHHEITAIAMAAYTFTAFTLAIVSIVRYRKFNSPVYTASKIISLAAACVSMLTLESTLLTTFSDGTMDAVSQKIMLGASGGVISLFIMGMAVFMIKESITRLGKLKSGEITDGKQG